MKSPLQIGHLGHVEYIPQATLLLGEAEHVGQNHPLSWTTTIQNGTHRHVRIPLFNQDAPFVYHNREIGTRIPGSEPRALLLMEEVTSRRGEGPVAVQTQVGLGTYFEFIRAVTSE